MRNRVYILGGHQTDFAQNWARNNLDLFDAFSDTVHTGLAKANLEPSDIDVAHVGNFTAELFCNQGHLGGFFASTDKHFFKGSYKQFIKISKLMKYSKWHSMSQSGLEGPRRGKTKKKTK